MDALEKILAELQLMQIRLQIMIDFKAKANAEVSSALGSRFFNQPTAIDNIISCNNRLNQAIDVIVAFKNNFKQQKIIPTKLDTK